MTHIRILVNFIVKSFGNTKNYYGVSKDSKTSKYKYIKFLKKNNLYFKICQNVGLQII